MKITINRRQRQFVCDELEFQPLQCMSRPTGRDMHWFWNQ